MCAPSCFLHAYTQLCSASIHPAMFCMHTPSCVNGNIQLDVSLMLAHSCVLHAFAQLCPACIHPYPTVFCMLRSAVPGSHTPGCVYHAWYMQLSPACTAITQVVYAFVDTAVYGIDTHSCALHSCTHCLHTHSTHAAVA